MASRPCSLPRVPPVAPDALRSNASSFAAVAFSAPPAGSTPAVLLSMAGAAHTTRSTPPHSCVPTPEGTASCISVLACITVPANPRVSWDSGCIDHCWQWPRPGARRWRGARSAFSAKWARSDGQGCSAPGSPGRSATTCRHRQ